MKKHLKVLIITSLVILLPILAGLLLWEQLPEQVPNHWNFAGEVDGWSSKSFVVFGMPLIMLGFHWLCAIATFADPKKDQHPSKVLHLVFWLIPAISAVVLSFSYAAAMGTEVRVEILMPILMGLVFVIIGNYLPKCKQNYTIGIKIPWTLNNEENWNKTHRLAGRLWVVCGFIIMLSGFFGGFWVFLILTFLMVLVPMIYSYLLHRKGE